MILELKKARQLLELDGWVGPDIEPFSVIRGPGLKLNPRHWSIASGPDEIDYAAPLWVPTKTFRGLDPRGAEAVESYGVLGALLQVGLGPAEWEWLGELAKAPAGVQNWLRASDRSRADVLGVFTEAIKRSKKMGERR